MILDSCMHPLLIDLYPCISYMFIFRTYVFFYVFALSTPPKFAQAPCGTNAWGSRGWEAVQLDLIHLCKALNPKPIEAPEANKLSPRQSPPIQKLFNGKHSSQPLLGPLTFQQGREFRSAVAQDVGPGYTWEHWSPGLSGSLRM